MIKWLQHLNYKNDAYTKLQLLCQGKVKRLSQKYLSIHYIVSETDQQICKDNSSSKLLNMKMKRKVILNVKKITYPYLSILIAAVTVIM